MAAVGLVLGLILDVQLGDLTDEMAALLAFWKLIGFGGQAFDLSHDLVLFSIVIHSPSFPVLWFNTGFAPEAAFMSRFFLAASSTPGVG